MEAEAKVEWEVRIQYIWPTSKKFDKNGDKGVKVIDIRGYNFRRSIHVYKNVCV